jgi:5-methylthioadenosine/S-adenosylhomocysteine deaminase
MIIHCPVANMYLASGVAPVPAFRKAGIPVALATDGPGSNNSQDMLGTLKYTALLQKVNTLNAQILYPEDVLEMATLGGAKAMGMEDIGSLKKGMKADIILVDWQKPHIAPVHKPVSAIVYNANGNDVDTVIVDGKIVVKNKKSTLVDETALIEECQDRVNFLNKKKLG